MFEWFANTLRTYPEIAIFLSLAFGYYFGSFTYKGLGLGTVTANADCRGDHRPARHHRNGPVEVVLLPHVPVRHRLRGRAAVRQGDRQGWNAAGHVRGGAVRVLSSVLVAG